MHAYKGLTFQAASSGALLIGRFNKILRDHCIPNAAQRAEQAGNVARWRGRKCRDACAAHNDRAQESAAQNTVQPSVVHVGPYHTTLIFEKQCTKCIAWHMISGR